MNSNFRLYNSINSSYFDLISGDKETQQTKGLGLVLSKSEEALKAFLKIRAIKARIGEIDIANLSRIIVNCELISNTENKLRADVLIRLYRKGKPYVSLLIEAKSINKSTSAKEAEIQTNNYLSKEAFEEVKEFGANCFGVTLTKLPSYTSDKGLISITWEDIIEAFHEAKTENNQLLNDYFDFITNINGAMKFYEKEVYSIPSADWSQQAINDYSIYECPNEGRYIIKQKPLYITFRKNGGGEMEKLYKIEKIIILNFKADYEAFLLDETYDQSYRDRVKAYAEYMLEKEKWKELPSDTKQVFVLSNNPIELKNRPKPERNNSFRAYYELADLLNKEIL